MRRVIFAVNILIAIAALSAVGVYFWFFRLPLPKTSGTISARVSAPVTVDRDKLGVPHIHGKSIDDALFVQGYVTAQDRLWQMDSLRRFSAGELSEIVGPAALEIDKESRRLRGRRIAEEWYVALPAEEKIYLAAYARGVNAYIEANKGHYSFEFAVLGYDPKPWSVVDSLLIGLYMYRNLTTTWENKLQKAQMLSTGDAAKVNYLFPYRSGEEFMPGGDVQPGSNGWAVAGSHTSSGKALLSNDMHLEFSIPGIWFMTHIEAPGLNVSGVALPGMPGIIVGHNDRIAWGCTNLHFDVQDLYIERMDLRTGQYLFNGKVEQARGEREIILIKGKPAVEVTNWVTRHGPVWKELNGKVLTLRWAAAQLQNFGLPLVEINKARNWTEFTKALSRFPGPGQNFVYADVDGNIGYHATGQLPIRRNYWGDVPVDGSSGENEWDGYIPFDELPQAFNPKNGYIVTANQNPFPVDYKYRVSGYFASQYRSKQILDMLRAMGNKVTPQETLRIQKDVYSGFSRMLGRQLVAAYDKRKATNPAFADPVALLRTWDGQMDGEKPEGLVVTLAFQYVRKAIAERASPGNADVYTLQLSPAVMGRLLRERPAGWFKDYDEMLLKAFADSLDEGRRMQGDAVKNWKYGKYTFLAVDHPVGSKLPLVGSYFNLPPTIMSGGSTSVKQTTRKLGPSERFNAVVGDWEQSLLNIPFGQSGHVASSHYKDEWDAYYDGTSFPMQFNQVEAKSTVTFQKP